MIEPMETKVGQPRARCVCDECGAEQIIPVQYERHKGGTGPRRVNEGAANRKLSHLSWDVRRGTVCPDCVARKKAPAAPETTPEPTKDTEAMEAVKEPALREPTPKQKREIIGLLEVVYDDAAKRFKDGESDKTVADAIGGGVLFGWVARIREELFGPDTRNQEVEALRKDLGKLADDIQAHQAELRDAREAVKVVEKKVSALVASMAALKSRVDKVA